MELVYDPTRPEVRRNPFPLYEQLQEHDPVHWSEPMESWIITRYDDVRRIALSRDMSADSLTPFYEASTYERRELVTELLRYLYLWLPFRDPPEHTRLRRLLNTVFTPAAFASMRPTIIGTIEYVFRELDTSQPLDFVRDVAMLIPGYVIMDMLDIPREDFPTIKRWSDDMRLFIMSARSVPDKYQRAQDGCMNMAAYFREVIQQRRADPGDDFISRMISARDESNALSEDELVATCMLILFAGHETTTSLLSNSVKALIDHPEQFQRLRRDPDLVDTAVEEFLRYAGPTTAITRAVAQDHELGGRELKKGERVFAMINAANRDGLRFQQPHALDLGRSPNPHLTFGQGAHFCLGAPLARLEARTTFSLLAERFSEIRLACNEVEWMDSMVTRGLESLPIEFKQ